MSISDSANLCPTDLTESFSEVLCVTDSDETCSDQNKSLGGSPSTKENEVIDLTILSYPDSELPEKPANTANVSSTETPCSRIELPDSDSSSPSLKMSALHNGSFQMSSLVQTRLNKFFDNIPAPIVGIGSRVINETQSSRCRFMSNSCSESKEHIDINETQESTDASIKLPTIKSCSNNDTEISGSNTNELSDSEIFPDGIETSKPRFNISAKININIKIRETDSTEAQQQKEQVVNVDPTRTNLQSCHSPAVTERFITAEMMNILTELYGNTWQNPEMLKHCRHAPKSTLKAKVPFETYPEDAMRYENNFKANKDKLLIHMFAIYNDRVFKKKLNVPVNWNNKLTKTAGRCLNIKKNGERTCKLELSVKVITSVERMRSTLIHEMCHAAAWIFDKESGHGKCWKDWTRRAMAAFPELPPITVCHQYEIEYKYTYQCVLCKTRYNTHSRSKKVENIRCSQCYGTIELYINKKSKNGEVNYIPVKSAKGFALFVKEQYKKFRCSTKNHADTMKMLGEEFSSLSTEQKKEYL